MTTKQDASPLPKTGFPPETPLGQCGAAAWLTERGCRVSPKTLQKLRTIGGGPKFFKSGKYVFYEVENLHAWAESRRSETVGSTSELQAS